MLAVMTFGGLAFHSRNLNRRILLSPKEGELLAMVVTQASKSLRKERILADLWSDRSDSDARNALNTCLWELKKKFERQQLTSELAHLHVTRDAVHYTGDAHVDSLEFSAVAHSFLSMLGAERAAPDQDQSVSTALDAIMSYKGAFLDGFDSDWIGPERTRLEELFCRLCRHSSHLLAERGRIGSAIECSRRILGIDPYHEGAHIDLIRLLALNGQRASALRQYGQYSDILKHDLGIEPPAAASVLRASIISGDLFDYIRDEVNKVGKPIRAHST